MTVHAKESRFWEGEPGTVVVGNKVGMGTEERCYP